MTRIRSVPTQENRVALVLLVPQMAIAVGALLVNVFSARALGPSGRGALALHLQLTYIITVVVLLGRDRSYLATIGQLASPDRATQQSRDLLRLPLVLALVTAVAAGLAFAAPTPMWTAALAAGYLLVITGNMMSRVSRSAAITAVHPWPFARAVLASQILLVAVSVALLVLRIDRLEVWFVAYGLTLALPFLCQLVAAGPNRSLDGREREQNRAARRLGLRLVPSQVGEMALLRADRLLIPLLSSYYQLGIYVVAATMAELASWPLSQYIDSHTPRWREEFEARTISPWRILRQTSIFSLLISVAVAVPAYLAIPLLFGSEYRAAAALIPLLSVATALFAVSRVVVALTTVADLTRWASLVNGAGVASSLGLCVLLVPRHGALGASYASLVAYGVCAVIGLGGVLRVAQELRALPPDSTRARTTEEMGCTR